MWSLNNMGFSYHSVKESDGESEDQPERALSQRHTPRFSRLALVAIILITQMIALCGVGFMAYSLGSAHTSTGNNLRSGKANAIDSTSCKSSLPLKSTPWSDNTSPQANYGIYIQSHVCRASVSVHRWSMGIDISSARRILPRRYYCT